MTQAAAQKDAFFISGFSTFAVKDIGEAKRFYGETLGLDVSDTNEGMSLGIPGGANVFVYPKGDPNPRSLPSLT